MTTHVPGWFIRALETPYENRTVEVCDVPIHYLYWRSDAAVGEKPGLVFVHGNGAHAHWWTFLAPFFLSDYQVAAIDQEFAVMGQALIDELNAIADPGERRAG